MNRPPEKPDWPLAAIALLAVVGLSGCALDRLPRIDPSGERLLVFPGSEPVIGPVASPIAGSTIPPTAGAIAPPTGNLTAPPVLPAGSTASSSPRCPLCPLCPLGGCCPLCPLGDGPKTIIGPLADGPPPAVPVERVTLTPGRVLAPVGSEVVLRAGVCGEDGYLRTNRKIEWMLGQQGAGQFATIGEQGNHDFMRYPWSTPKKIDNHYAVGYTQPYRACLRRGTPTPADDMQIQRGEAWVTVTSPSEGTSYITAYAPDGENWNTRRAQATIYWIDAKWQLPPPAVVAAGQPHMLTTTVTRQTDGAPLAGWIVRYEVADASGAQLGYEAGQAAEAPTDAQGRASVEVRPTDSQPGTSRVRVTIVRPEQAGVAASPRLDIGSGETSVTWSDTAAGTQPLFPPVTPQPSLPVDPGLPVEPTPPLQPTPPQPGDNININEPGPPALSLRLLRTTTGEVKQNGQIAYKVSIQNTGQSAAQEWQLAVTFDEGLDNINDTQRNRKLTLDHTQFGALKPGEAPIEADLVFDIKTAGPHSVEANLAATGVSPEYDRDTFTAAPDVIATPTVELRIDLPARRPDVGKLVRLRVIAENMGDTPAEDVAVTVDPDVNYLQIRSITPAYVNQTQEPGDGTANTRLGTLGPRQKVTIEYGLECLQQTTLGQPAKVRVRLRSTNGVNLAEEEKTEIIAAASAPPLTLSSSVNNNPIGVSGTTTMVLTLKNNSQTPLTNINVQITVPNGLVPQLSNAQITEPGIQFAPAMPLISLSPAIPRIDPGKQVQIVIPFDAQQPGSLSILSRAIWQGAPGWANSTVGVTVNP